jgi:hypothetical protein
MGDFERGVTDILKWFLVVLMANFFYLNLITTEPDIDTY